MEDVETLKETASGIQLWMLFFPLLVCDPSKTLLSLNAVGRCAKLKGMLIFLILRGREKVKNLD